MGIWNARPGIALEQLRGFEDPSDMEAYCGTLISFREKSESPGIPNHSQWKESPTCQVVFRREVADRRYKVTLNLKTMYIFSDTASMELADSKLCGIGVLSGASVEEVDGRKEVRIQIKPLLIGTGGLGQSDEHGLWLHNQADDSDDL